jgi:hypothetical protein
MPMRMFEKRLRGYRAMGYESSALPSRYEGLTDEPVTVVATYDDTS